METSIDCLQWGHVTRSVSDGVRRISSSQALHLKWMLRIAKPLALLFLVIVPVEAQTVADVARSERARHARLRAAQVYSGKGTSTENVTPRTAAPAAAVNPAPAQPAAPPAAAPVASPAPAAKPAAPAAAPAVPTTPDPAAKWNEALAKLRARIPDLESQERTLQLQVNQLTNDFFAPISDQGSRDQAQSRLGETQNRLSAVRLELEQTKKVLNDMQVQGPPKQ